MRERVKEKLYAKHPVCHLNIVILYLEADKELETATASLLPRTRSYFKEHLLLCA